MNNNYEIALEVVKQAKARADTMFFLETNCLIKRGWKKFCRTDGKPPRYARVERPAEEDLLTFREAMVKQAASNHVR